MAKKKLTKSERDSVLRNIGGNPNAFSNSNAANSFISNIGINNNNVTDQDMINAIPFSREIKKGVLDIEYFDDITDIKDYSKYGIPITRGRTYNKDRAQMQSEWQQAGHMLAQMASTVAGETVSGFGAIAEIVDSIVDEARGEEADFNNLLMSLGTDIQDFGREKAPIYRENPNKSWDISDPAWWFEHGVSTASTFGLMIPGYAGAAAVSKGLSMLGKMGKVANAATKIGKIARGVGKAGARAQYLSKVGTSAAIMRNAENLKESMEVSNEMRNNVLRLSDSEFNEILADDELKQKYYEESTKPLTKENYADYVAARSGWKTYNENAKNIIFDVIQVAPLFRAGKALSSTSKIKTPSKVLNQNLLASGKASMSRGKSILHDLGYYGSTVGVETVTEGIEEAINYIGAKEGTYLGNTLLNKKEDSRYSERLKDYVEDPKLWEQAFWGAIGGGVFSGGARGLASLKETIRNTTNPNSRSERISEIAARSADLGSLVKDINTVNDGYDPYNKDAEGNNIQIENENHANKVKERIIDQTSHRLGIKASKHGNFNLLLEQLNSKEFVDKMKGIAGEENASEVPNIINTIKDRVKESKRLYEEFHSNIIARNDIPEHIKPLLIDSGVNKSVELNQHKRDRAKLADKINSKLANSVYGNISRKINEEDNNANFDSSLRKAGLQILKNDLQNTIDKAVGEKDVYLQSVLQERLDRVNKELVELSDQHGIKALTNRGVELELINNKSEDVHHEIAESILEEGVSEVLTDTKKLSDKIEKDFDDLGKEIYNAVDKDFDDRLSKLTTSAEAKSMADEIALLKNEASKSPKYAKQLQALENKVRRKQRALARKEKRSAKAKPKEQDSKEDPTVKDEDTGDSEDTDGTTGTGTTVTDDTSKTKTTEDDVVRDKQPNEDESDISDDLTEDEQQDTTEESDDTSEETGDTTKDDTTGETVEEEVPSSKGSQKDAADTEEIDDTGEEESEESIDSEEEDSKLSKQQLDDIQREMESDMMVKGLNPNISLFISSIFNMTNEQTLDENNSITITEEQKKVFEKILNDIKSGTKLYIKYDPDYKDQKNNMTRALALYTEDGTKLFHFNVIYTSDNGYYTNHNGVIYTVNSNWVDYVLNTLSEEESNKLLNTLADYRRAKLYNNKKDLKKALDSLKEQNVLDILNINRENNIDYNSNEFYPALDHISRVATNDVGNIFKKTTIFQDKFIESLSAWNKRIKSDIAHTVNIRRQFLKHPDLVLTTDILSKSSGSIIRNNKEYLTVDKAFSQDGSIENTPLMLIPLDNKSVARTANGAKMVEESIEGYDIINGSLIYLPVYTGSYSTEDTHHPSQYIPRAAEYSYLDMESVPKEVADYNNKVYEYVLKKVKEAENLEDLNDDIKHYVKTNFAKGKLYITLSRDSETKKIRLEYSDSGIKAYRQNGRTEISEKTLSIYLTKAKRNAIIEYKDNLRKFPSGTFTDFEGTEFKSYSEYLIKTGAIVTDYGSIRDESGNLVSNVTAFNTFNQVGQPMRILVNARTQVHYEQPRKGRITSVAEYADTLANHPYSNLFNLIDKLGIKFDSTDIRKNSKKDGTENAIMAYDAKTNTMVIYERFNNMPDGLGKVLQLAHESIHKIFNEKATDEHIKKLDKIRDRVVKELNSNELRDSLTEEELNTIDTIKNEITRNSQELLTYGLSNTLFAKVLNSIESSESTDVSKKSLARELLDIILDIIDKAYGSTALTEVTSILEDVLVNEDTNTTDTNRNKTSDSKGDTSKGIDEDSNSKWRDVANDITEDDINDLDLSIVAESIPNRKIGNALDYIKSLNKEDRQIVRESINNNTLIFNCL